VSSGVAGRRWGRGGELELIDRATTPAAIMIFYSTILVSYILRYRAKKPFNHQVQLFTWWPNALRPKSKKKGVVQGEISSVGDEKAARGANIAGHVDDKVLVFTAKEHRDARIMLGVCVLTTLLIFIR
jgi:hypothetical protein